LAFPAKICLNPDKVYSFMGRGQPHNRSEVAESELQGLQM
jgi:hypothetical protein